MSAVVADTHAIVWYLSKLEKLSETAVQTLDQASLSGQMIYISAISIVEL
jgi:PIN domain nuclease of toxin-antitoxin system